jgi:hypothetical protein
VFLFALVDLPSLWSSLFQVAFSHSFSILIEYMSQQKDCKQKSVPCTNCLSQ